MIRSIFISKPLEEVGELKDFCLQHEISLHARSLIQFEPRDFKVKDPYQVIFFASIRSAIFFLEKEKLPKGIAIACVGEKTAEKIKKFGYSVDFIGKKSGSPEEVALSFKQWVGNRTVLFPHSTITAGTIANLISDSQKIEVSVYSTIYNCAVIHPCDLYVFSSPSNFESFISCNPIPVGKIVAWGNTTASAIRKKGLFVDYTMINSELSEIKTFVQGL